ncbi:MAG: hypothetical protein ACOCV4_03300 [Myxococcota bacterium]
MSKRLPTIEPARERLGAPTIMDPDLAARHGVPYVHLAVFAIDVDRVRQLLEAQEADAELPFAWEVFLTEVYLLTFLDLGDEGGRAMVEEACAPALEPGRAAHEPPLGGQLPFAVYDAVARGEAPSELGDLFRRWRKRPEDLVRQLAPLWEDPAPHIAALADLCIDTPVDPPLAEPTARALDELHDSALGAPDDEEE